MGLLQQSSELVKILVTTAVKVYCGNSNVVATCQKLRRGASKLSHELISGKGYNHGALIAIQPPAGGPKWLHRQC